MKVEVYHNISRDASFGLNAVFANGRRIVSDFAERHQLVKVFEYETDRSAEFVLEDAFETFNVGTDELAQAYRARRLRSLSVGDVLILENPAGSGKTGDYSVESSAFKLRDPDELRIVTDLAEAEKLIRERYQFQPQEELNVTVPWAGNTCQR